MMVPEKVVVTSEHSIRMVGAFRWKWRLWSTYDEYGLNFPPRANLPIGFLEEGMALTAGGAHRAVERRLREGASLASRNMPSIHVTTYAVLSQKPGRQTLSTRELRAEHASDSRLAARV